MMSVRASSLEKGTTSVTALGGHFPNQPADQLLRQIKHKVADVIFNLGFLLDNLFADYFRKQEALNKIEHKVETQTPEWNAATESNNKVETLEKYFSQNQEDLNICANNISSWEKQIEEMEENIQKAKDLQEEIRKLNHKQLDDEIEVGVHHVEKAQKLEAEIKDLKLGKFVIKRRLLVSTAKYRRMKASLPVDFCT
ncbi:unnamed protein product [Vicia faba]|uniref:Uncharacterized protein n=1 Tax=Vicia faba TaxID=3906 RepID=A0AAV1BBJ3_VICFA|nr:unnamed protein product [Vicia faba]